LPDFEFGRNVKYISPTSKVGSRLYIASATILPILVVKYQELEQLEPSIPLAVIIQFEALKASSPRSKWKMKRYY
jgi:hypothetical protein